MVDKVSETLLEALRQLVAGPGEQRLYRSGKLPGLFASRTGPAADAITRALADGLLEVVRTETRGKSEVEWVRATPRGIQFLHDHDSPVRALTELRDVLRVTREGMPVWLLEVQQEFRAAGERLAEEMRAMNRRLEMLGDRVEAALQRTDVGRIPVANGASGIPWAREALAYLERRGEEGSASPCPLPELFTALRPRHGDLSLPAFLDGLRRMHEHRAVELMPFTESPENIPEPEYALAEGPVLLYYVKR